jgi:hypothetical protein
VHEPLIWQAQQSDAPTTRSKLALTRGAESLEDKGNYLSVHASALSRSYCRIWPLQFDAGIGSETWRADCANRSPLRVLASLPDKKTVSVLPSPDALAAPWKGEAKDEKAAPSLSPESSESRKQ